MKCSSKAFAIFLVLVLLLGGCINFKKVEDPVFSPQQGTYPPTQFVTISSPAEGASIFFTMDGSDPDEESFYYSEPIPVTSSMTIKAYATKLGLIPSNIIGASYVIQSSPNNPPFVRIISPYEGAVYSAGDTITTIVSALDGDGFIVQVEFFVNGESMFIDFQGPGYDFAWENVPLGDFRIDAVATDNKGGVGNASVNVSVVS